MTTLAQEIARFVAGLEISQVPQDVVEKLRGCVLNGFGIAMGSYQTPYHGVAAQAAIAMDGEQANGATLLLSGKKTSVGGAAIANGALFHGRGQEDTCGTVHLGAVVIPLLTAMTEARNYPLERFLPSLLAGYEVAGLFDKEYGVKTAPAGLRASPLYGTLGAAAAAGKMMGLNEDQLAAALANAASFTGGILQSFTDGTDEWRYQVGVAARNGLTAAELAKAGSVSAMGALEGKAGFVRAYARVAPEPAKLLDRLGKEWSALRVTYKPFPVCAFNQTPVTAGLALREKLGGQGIRAVRVRMNPYETGYAGMTEKGPFTTISGTLMSIPFCIAVTILHGAPDMRRMTTYDDPAINGLVEKIALVSDEAVPNLSAVIEVDTADGKTITHEQRMTFKDYAYDWNGVSQLMRRIGAQEGIAPEIYDRLEAFARGLPPGGSGVGGIKAVVDLFTQLPRVRDAA
jgi:2-methylcitrate dehydratase PrpD